MAMRTQLLEFGFNEEFVMKAIKFIYPNNFSKQLKFPPETQFQDIDLKIREEDPSIASCEINYSIVFPSCVIAPDDFSRTLNELGLCPRSMVNLTYY